MHSNELSPLYLELTDDEKPALIELLCDAIEGSRFPPSPQSAAIQRPTRGIEPAADAPRP